MQFQGVLWPLLGAALDVSSIESETLVEEGLRLLSAVLGCIAEVPPQLLVGPFPTWWQIPCCLGSYDVCCGHLKCASTILVSAAALFAVVPILLQQNSMSAFMIGTCHVISGLALLRHCLVRNFATCSAVGTFQQDTP